jgi:hypothetical protein
MPPKPEYLIFSEVTSYLKIYPKFSRLYQYDQPIKVRTPGYEPRIPKKPSCLLTTNPLSHLDSLRRTKTTITDLTLANDFDLFVTFTFDPKKVNRQNPDECKAKMSKWLKNQREIRGHFAYIIVPEYHKDGKSLHFHALLKNYSGRLTKTAKKVKNRPVYNIKSYQLGFSTAVKIDNIAKVSSYIKKYITKEMPEFSGKKRYWASTGLIRPVILKDPTLKPNPLRKTTTLYRFKNLTVYEIVNTLPNTTNLTRRIQNGSTKYRPPNREREDRPKTIRENLEKVQ